jgi:hypothetical protein
MDHGPGGRPGILTSNKNDIIMIYHIKGAILRKLKRNKLFGTLVVAARYPRRSCKTPSSHLQDTLVILEA